MTTDDIYIAGTFSRYVIEAKGTKYPYYYYITSMLSTIGTNDKSSRKRKHTETNQKKIKKKIEIHKNVAVECEAKKKSSTEN